VTEAAAKATKASPAYTNLLLLNQLRGRDRGWGQTYYKEEEEANRKESAQGREKMKEEQKAKGCND
jgi:hypothetical protein